MTQNFPRHTPEQRFDVAGHADFCIKWLRSQKLEVLAVRSGSAYPVITIRNTELCGDFEGQVQAFERGPNGTRRYRFVMRHGCEVRWAEHQEVAPRSTTKLLSLFALGRGVAL